MVWAITVEQRRSRLRATRGTTASKQRQSSSGIDKSGEHTDPTESCLRPKARSVSSALPGEVVRSAELTVDQAQVVPGPLTFRQRDEPVNVEGASGRHDPLVGGPASFPELSDMYKRLDRRRQEVLALVETNDGLEPLEQSQIWADPLRPV